MAIDTIEMNDQMTLRLVTKDGRKFHMTQRYINSKHHRYQIPDPDADIVPFAAALFDLAARAGASQLGSTRQLAFMQSTGGLVAMGVFFLASLPISIGVIWSLFDGAQPTTHSRNAWDAVILLAGLPVFTGSMFLNNLRERREVLQGQKSG